MCTLLSVKSRWSILRTVREFFTEPKTGTQRKLSLCDSQCEVLKDQTIISLSDGNGAECAMR